jgi:glycosyltransferase involved in cell wall biosynthesis
VTAAHDAVPLISICVPTHNGRRGTLSALLEGILEQATPLPGLVEVCIGDNASHDGTAELVAELARNPACPVAYFRHREDMGLARNLLSTVEMARGTYCWLLGSDDLLADGALAKAAEMLERLPGATGYAVGAIHVDAVDPLLRSRQLPRAFHPPGEQTRLIEGLDAVYDQCGNAWCALSWSIVDRHAWLRAARKHLDTVLAHPVFPQVVVLGNMAVERPRWGWLAEPLVHQRNATTFLFETSAVSLADRWSVIIGGAAAAWGAVLGRRGGARWRRRMRLLHQVWGHADDIRATKLYDEPSLRSQLRLARVCFGAFWPSRVYWRTVALAALTPTWLMRARYGEGGRLVRSEEIAPGGLALSGCVPDRMHAGAIARMDVEIRNDERGRSVPATGPYAVTVGQRWSTNDGRPLERRELGLNELATLPQSLPCPVPAKRAVHAEIPLFAPLEAGSYRVEVALHQHGRGWLDETCAVPALTGEVEILARGDRPGT